MAVLAFGEASEGGGPELLSAALVGLADRRPGVRGLPAAHEGRLRAGRQPHPRGGVGGRRHPGRGRACSRPPPPPTAPTGSCSSVWPTPPPTPSGRSRWRSASAATSARRGTPPSCARWRSPWSREGWPGSAMEAWAPESRGTTLLAIVVLGGLALAAYAAALRLLGAVPPSAPMARGDRRAMSRGGRSPRASWRWPSLAPARAERAPGAGSRRPGAGALAAGALVGRAVPGRHASARCAPRRVCGRCDVGAGRGPPHVARRRLRRDQRGRPSAGCPPVGRGASNRTRSFYGVPRAPLYEELHGLPATGGAARPGLPGPRRAQRGPGLRRRDRRARARRWPTPACPRAAIANADGAGYLQGPPLPPGRGGRAGRRAGA